MLSPRESDAHIDNTTQDQAEHCSGALGLRGLRVEPKVRREPRKQNRARFRK